MANSEHEAKGSADPLYNCLICREFYGPSHTLNLCSVCYRKYQNSPIPHRQNLQKLKENILIQYEKERKKRGGEGSEIPESERREGHLEAHTGSESKMAGKNLAELFFSCSI